MALQKDQLAHNQGSTGYLLRRLTGYNPWTVCLLIGSFVPIPHVPPTCQDARKTSESSLQAEAPDLASQTTLRAVEQLAPITFVTCGSPAVVIKCPALPKELKLGPSTSAEVGRAKNIAVRVMDRLQQAEAHESEPYYQQHIRQAWIIISLLQKGVSNPFVLSSYTIYGKHPQDVWPAIVADRKARLCDEYFTWYTSDDVLRPDVPKIPHNTADADTHAANEASHDDWDIAGLVPTKERIV